MSDAQVIALYQPTLYAVAMKMLGSISDAEDVVHDAFLKWMTIDTSKIENTKAYLIKVVTNKCLNVLQHQKKSDHSELCEQHASDEEEEAVISFDHETVLKEAWKSLSKKLEPVERSAYVLREFFNVEYDELQLILNKKSENCRKIVSRAKLKLKSAEIGKVSLSIPDVKLFDSFKIAYQKGNLTQFVQQLTADLFQKKPS